jgi:branched-chain amino acid transport system substrate-binding protein
MRGLRPKLFALLAILLLVAAACNGDDDGGGTTGATGGETTGATGTTGEASGEPIRIGISLPLTGDFSQPGGAAEQGYRIWADLTNEAGGVLGRPVELVILDDASSQDTVVSDYNRLITEENVDLLLGTFSSLLNIPASAVAERNQMVYVEPAGGSPDLFDDGYEFLFFAQQATAPHQADKFVEWILSLPEDERPTTAAYPSQDDPFALPVIESIRDQLTDAGIENVYENVYPPDTTNFDAIANDIQSSGAELVAQGAVFEDGVGLVRSFQRIGYNPAVLFQTSAPSNSSEYAEGIGEDNTEGVFYAVSWHQDTPTPMNAEFVSAFDEQYGGIPAEDAADAFAAAQVLQTAVEAVGSLDQVAIKDWLHSNTVDTILGELSWDETGAPQGEFLLAQWQGPQAEIVLPEEVATTDTIVYPKPEWAS